MSLSAVYSITFNRLIATKYPIRYVTELTRKMFHSSSVSFTLIVTSTNVMGQLLMYSFLTDSPTGHWIGEILIRSIYIFYFIFCVFSNTSIVKAIAKSGRYCQPNNVSNSQRIWRTIKLGEHMVPLLIMSTYLLFVVLPFIAQTICRYSYGRPSMKYSISVWVWAITVLFNNISDALIYTIIDKDIRNYVRNIFGRSLRSQSQNQSQSKTNVLVSLSGSRNETETAETRF